MPELLKQLALTLGRTAVAKAVELLKKKLAQDKWANKPNQPWGCQRCQTFNYMGGQTCSGCGNPSGRP